MNPHQFTRGGFQPGYRSRQVSGGGDGDRGGMKFVHRHHISGFFFWAMWVMSVIRVKITSKFARTLVLVWQVGHPLICGGGGYLLAPPVL